MITRLLRVSLLFCLIFPLLESPGLAASEETNILLEELVKEGVLSPERAAKVSERVTRRMEEKQVAEEPSENKLKLNSWVNKLGIYGDGRLRYEIREGQNAFDDNRQVNQFRYRLRLGLTADLTDNLQLGFRLMTGTGNRGTNVTFGGDTVTTSGTTQTINGPFAKTADTLSVDLMYLNYKPYDWLSLTGGKMLNPLVTTRMVWHVPITPEGLAEQFKFKIGGWDLFGNFGQFLYDDANPENPFGAGNFRNDVWLLANQVGVRYNFNEKRTTWFQIAPVFYTYTGDDGNLSMTFTNEVIPNGGINDLAVLEVPVEFGFTLGKMPMRIFGDFAYNTAWKDRAINSGNPNLEDNGMAYTAGIQIGKVKKKGDLEFTLYYQRLEAYSLDQNLIDDDFFDGKLNMQGFVFMGTYAITDSLSFSINYGVGDQIDRNIGTGASTGAIPADPLRNYQLFQAELLLKF